MKAINLTMAAVAGIGAAVAVVTFGGLLGWCVAPAVGFAVTTTYLKTIGADV